jgi:5-methyltetrahydropteroyltriglutamate--homocysteine methyltransferase
MPSDRIALHVCRGKSSPDERVALAGDYRPLVGLLSRVKVGVLILEMCTARADEIEVLRRLPEDRRIGVGVVNQKSPLIEGLAQDVLARAERAIALFGPNRVLLNPDCGFATFADNPIAPPDVAERQLAAIAEAARILRRKYQLD